MQATTSAPEETPLGASAVTPQSAPAPSPPEAPAATPPHAATPTTPTTRLGEDLYALVVYLHKNCNADLFEAVGALELTLTQIKLLHHLEEAERELTLKDAAELVHVSLPAASRTVDELVRRGFVERREDAEDRRMKRVRLADDGRSVIRRLNAARLSGLIDFTESLTETERRALSAALSALLSRDDVAACRPEGLTP